jgi:hypothetical protein
MNELPELTRQHYEKDKAGFYLPSAMKENFFEDNKQLPGNEK